MTVEHINTETGEVVQLPTREEAQRLTERIRLALDRVSTSWADLGERIAEAYQKRVDMALGYGSWAEYAEAELKPQHGLAAEIRRELVGMLSAEGMSTRAIAPTVGVGATQVHRDRQVFHMGAPAPQSPTTEPGVPPAPQAVEDAGHRVPTAPAPRPVVGLDGKTYSRPTPSAPKRRPLPDQAHDAAAALTAALERVERVFADDRFAQNAEQVARLTRSHLSRTSEVCQDLISQLP